MSNKWGIRVACGWREDAPSEVALVFNVHAAEGQLAALSAQAHSRTEECLGAADATFEESRDKLDGVKCVARAFDSVGVVLGFLENPSVAVASLTFVNLDPLIVTPPMSPRPASIRETHSVASEAIRRFCEFVAGSIQDKETGSVCEWAFLNFTRIDVTPVGN